MYMCVHVDPGRSLHTVCWSWKKCSYNVISTLTLLTLPDIIVVGSKIETPTGIARFSAGGSIHVRRDVCLFILHEVSMGDNEV
jgi:hypothetical protein